MVNNIDRTYNSVMSAIVVDNLSKFYTVTKKEPGFLGSLRSFVRRQYETIKAVEDISFSIEEGELVGFIGPNGAGKTTTLKTLSGLLYPTSGSVSVLSYKPYERKDKFLKQISLVMGQKNQLWWDLPPIDTIELNKEIYDISDKQYKIVLNQLLELLEVSDILTTPTRKLSLGQRMKMELIASLIHSPKVLFLDEPTIGLDVVMQQKLRDFIKDYNERYKATIILTSHYMADVEALCKRVIIINHGKILFDGLLSDLIKKHSPHKQIIIKLRQKVDKKTLEKFGNIKRYEYPEIVLTASSEKIGETASRLLKELQADDISIIDPEIEDVIRELYTSQQQ